ncbi:HNH endonuclease [Specibacter sp. NPDC057265]|uniref:HNH endonuclease n=1 Tax=Specibacter sp. NPDC057265 TaxID=3346075 RepID=UPI003645C55F
MIFSPSAGSADKLKPTAQAVMAMVVPELFASAGSGSASMPWEGPAAAAHGVHRRAHDAVVAGGAPVGNTGSDVMAKCDSLRGLCSSVIESGGMLFDPAMLAQLDAALAHQFSAQAQIAAQGAAAEFNAAVRKQEGAQLLLSLHERAATAQRAASHAEKRAVQASEVITALGGVPTELGFDAAAVESLSAKGFVDLINTLEEAKNSMAAAQAQVQTLFVAQQRLTQARSGVPHKRIGQGIAQQIALARRESPHRGRQLCELAEVLVREMPCSMRAFSEGRLSEYRATIIAAETVFLSLADRAQVDRQIGGAAAGVELMGTGELRSAARKAAYTLDPESFVKRRRKAANDRYVSLRPAPDGMTFLTALIPLKQGVRILNTLTKIAGSAQAAGDERGKGQIMADALMHRLIHHAACDAGAGTVGDHRGAPAADGSSMPAATGALREPWCTAVAQPDVALELIMTDRTLFGNDNEPAMLVGYEAIPAPLARDMVLGEGPPEASGGGTASSPRVWLKRLFTHPDSNGLLAMDSKARFFPENLKEFLRIRDQRCQSPYCDAPIREYDHIKSYAAGGSTSLNNGQGLCTACNQAKEASGWSFERDAGAQSGYPETRITTPTGHRYISTAPPLPGPSRNGSNRGARRRC